MDSNDAGNISDWEPLVSRSRVQHLKSVDGLGCGLLGAFAEEMGEHLEAKVPTSTANSRVRTWTCITMGPSLSTALLLRSRDLYAEPESES